MAIKPITKPKRIKLICHADNFVFVVAISSMFARSQKGLIFSVKIKKTFQRILYKTSSWNFSRSSVK